MFELYTVIVLGLTRDLVEVVPFTKWFMDHLINFMNNNYSFSLPLFHFPLIKTPSPSHIHFSLPVLKLITVKKIYVFKKLEVAMSWLNYSDVSWFSLQLIFFSLSSNRVLSPSSYHVFLNTNPSHIPKPFDHPLRIDKWLNNLYGLDCMSLIYC
jgi:hypothetical protein